MIKKRLVSLLSHAKKYIVYQVLWQWLSLLSQVVMIYSAAKLLERTLYGALSLDDIGKYGLFVLLAILLRFCFDRQASCASYKAERGRQAYSERKNL